MRLKQTLIARQLDLDFHLPKLWMKLRRACSKVSVSGSVVALVISQDILTLTTYLHRYTQNDFANS